MPYSSTRYRVKLLALVLALSVYSNSIRERTWLYREAVLHPFKSPWNHLFHFGDPSSFLLMTGLTREAFGMLHDIIKPPGHPDLQKRAGRKWSLSSEGQLGLFLFYIGSTMNYKFLCVIFGITPNPCSRMLRNMLKLVVRRLHYHPLAKIEFPSPEKMALFASMVQIREAAIDDVIGFMDGVALKTECTSERVTQNAFYSGYECDTTVNNVFTYGPDGKVFLAAINFPGSWADGSLCARFLDSIRRRIGHYKICVDQGFPRSGDAWNILVGPMNERSARRLHPTMREYMLRVSNVYVSLRQSSEWGMRALQASFPRFKKRLPSDAKQRRLVIQSIILTHNFRTCIVGRNQINTVFDPEYERYINLEGYDRIGQYYLRPEDFNTDNDDNNI